jgi:hypothetical protein
MNWVLAVLIVCALIIGVLGVAVVATFFVLGVTSPWFIYTSLGMGIAGGGLFLSTVISLIYLTLVAQKGSVYYVKE